SHPISSSACSEATSGGRPSSTWACWPASSPPGPRAPAWGSGSSASSTNSWGSTRRRVVRRASGVASTSASTGGSACNSASAPPMSTSTTCIERGGASSSTRSGKGILVRRVAGLQKGQSAPGRPRPAPALALAAEKAADLRLVHEPEARGDRHSHDVADLVAEESPAPEGEFVDRLLPLPVDAQRGLGEDADRLAAGVRMRQKGEIVQASAEFEGALHRAAIQSDGLGEFWKAPRIGEGP